MSTPIARKQSNRNCFTRSMVVPQLSQMYLDNCGDVLSYYRHLVDVDPWLWMRHGWIREAINRAHPSHGECPIDCRSRGSVIGRTGDNCGNQFVRYFYGLGIGIGIAGHCCCKLQVGASGAASCDVAAVRALIMMKLCAICWPSVAHQAQRKLEMRDGRCKMVLAVFFCFRFQGRVLSFGHGQIA